jgi:hypothetical protein
MTLSEIAAIAAEVEYSRARVLVEDRPEARCGPGVNSA